MKLRSLFRTRLDPMFCFELDLVAGNVWTHDVAGIGFFVCCTSGRLRLTDAEGATRILEAGERWGTTRPGRVVATAVAPVRLEVQVAGRRCRGEAPQAALCTAET